MKLLISLFLLIFPTLAHSTCGVDCVKEPTCTELGYSKHLSCPDGSIKCPFDASYIWCKSYTCEDGRYYIDPLTTKGYQCSLVTYHSLSCYDCQCKPPSDCKWTIANAGQASLSKECCDGSYSSCVSSCPSDIAIPKYSEPVYSTCRACNTDYRYISDFTCVEGYERSGNECIVKACEEGYSTQYQSVADCGKTGSLGYTWENKSKSGELLCGKCIIKPCPIAETSNPSAFVCERSSIESGWEHAQTSNYEGDEHCYEKECSCSASSTCIWTSGIAGTAELTDLCCNGHYATCTSTCPWVTIPEHSRATDSCSACGSTKPTAWECVEGYELTLDKKGCKIAQCTEGSATVAEGCGNGTGKDIGWSITDIQVGLSGTQPCYTCEKNECVSGDINSNVNTCVSMYNYPSVLYADKVKNKYFKGDDACYDCVCEAPADCNWESGTEQYGTLSELCCNGRYATCTSKCEEVEVPEFAHATTKCTGCNKTVNTSWACNEGYEKTDDGKGCKPAACEGFPISNACPEHGSCSTCLSGTETKYKLTSCEDGYEVDGNVCAISQCNVNCKVQLADCGTVGGWEFGEDCNLSGPDRCKSCKEKDCADGDINSSVTTCGYPTTLYASKPANGFYNGNNVCYSCQCDADSHCKWDDENKGQASVKTQCCNGKFEICEPNCKDTAVVPEHGKPVKQDCTACGETTQIIVDFECNVGYAKEGNKCIVVTCNENCSVDISGCGDSGDKGWSFGANCNMSGENQCKTCVAKTCTSGNTNSNVSDCTALPSTSYASKVENGYYSGNSKCYDCKCNAPTACKWETGNAGASSLGGLCCNGKYELCTSTCKEKQIPAHAHGTTQCTGCEVTVYVEWECDEGYVKNGETCVVAQCTDGCKVNIADCGTSGDKGWSFGANCNKSGENQCKTCTAKACSAGNTNNNVSDCTEFSSTLYAEKIANGAYSGDNKCFDCKCNAPAKCKWTEDNAKSANISGLCCNGYYETCESTCQGVKVPDNATSTGKCTGCEETVDTGWKCNTGWAKNAAGTACIEAPCDGFIIAGSCPTHGVCSTCPSGTTIKYRLDSCENGWEKNDTSTACQIAQCKKDCATSVDSCGQGIGKANGYTLGNNCNMSGLEQCKQCNKKSCPNDTNIAWSSNAACNSTKGSIGWVSASTSSFSGDDRCYSCTCSAPTTCRWTSSNVGSGTLKSLCCNGKYESCVSSCKEVTIPTNGKGTTQCTGCEKTVYTDFACNEGYKKNAAGTDCVIAECDDGSATDVSKCGNSGAQGWQLGTTVTGTSGTKSCYKCIAKTCESGDPNPDVSTCGYPSNSHASKPANGKYNGDNKCYSCQCNYPADCKWDNSNKDNGNISSLCCNGKYSSCTSTCTDTVTVPANATATTTSCKGCGQTVSIKTGWTCNEGYTKVGEACNVAQCNSGCVIKIADCGQNATGDKGWTLGANCNMSGKEQCKKCTAKSCPTDTNTGWTSASACETAKGTLGWTASATTDYNGDTTCYKCTCSYTSAQCPYTDSNKGTGTISGKCCNGQYKTCISNCNPVTIPAHAHATENCTGCGQTVPTKWECDEGYTKNGNTCITAQCNENCKVYASDCGSKGTSGWELSSNCNLSGTEQCKSCKKKTCESGCSTSYTSTSACQSANSWPTTVGVNTNACSVSNGDATCYKCSCNCDSSVYKWDNSNKGSATLTEQCCNGKYKTCKSSCTQVTIPANAHGTTQCTGCQSTVYTAWECDTGFVKNSAGTGCTASACPTGSATTAAGCKTTGSAGYKINSTIKGYNGLTPCYECVANGCSSGDTNSAVSSCGYSSTEYASKNANGDYDGEKACYTCSCTGDSYCKWTNSNKGTANLSTVCCNGKYKTCTSTCKDTVTVPANASPVKTTCTGCEQSTSITTSWTCNTGYVKTSDGKGCTPAACCAGSTSYNSATACKTAMGYPTTTGVNNVSAGCVSGSQTCYTCSCSCSSTYKWDSSNVGTYGKVSGTQCCNGKYDACVKNSNFPTNKSYPANSTPTYTTYTACNGAISEQVITGYTCNQCYTQSNGSCVASDCTSGYATEAAKCGNGTCKANGWTINTSSSGCSGSTTCYKCVAKSCPSGYATTAANCGTNGANGWTINSTKNTTCNGDTACYQCVAKTCDSTFQTDAANCGAGGSVGWKLDLNNKCYAGATTKYKCVSINGCSTGYSTSVQTTSNCSNTGSGWRVDFSGYNGNTPCGKCNCSAASGCTWTSSNKGTANLSGLCCNGNYATCTSTCSTSTYPLTSQNVANAASYTSCTGCSTTRYALSTCKSCYTKSGNTCVASTCPDGYSTAYQSVADCGTGGSTGWTFSSSGCSGSKICGKCTAKNGCSDGYSESIQTAANCGVGGSTGWTVSFSGYKGNTKCGKCDTKNGCASGYSASVQATSNCSNTGSGWSVDFNGYNGNTKCGKCNCSAASGCTWTSSNKGTATLSGLCCNGNYATCTSSCSTSTYPLTSQNVANAASYTSCTGCSTTRYALSTCNPCYTKSGNTCVASTCPSGYSKDYQSVSNCGSESGWVFTSSGCSADSVCGRCTCSAASSCTWTDSNKGTASLGGKCCNGKYATCTSTCSTTTYPLTSQNVANAASYTSCTGCNITRYALSTCKEGYTKSGNTCVVSTCASGYSTSYQSENDCGSGTGWSYSSNGKSGTKLCGKCTCSAASGCIWTSSNKGTANITDLCCNGKYATCSSTCSTTTYPFTSQNVANAASYTSCTGCNTTRYALSTCKEGYTKSGNECKEAACPSGYSKNYQSVTDCGSTGSNGWTYSSSGKSGTKLCGKCTARTCPSGCSASYASASNCGYPTTTGASVSGCTWPSGSTGAGNAAYSGQTRCNSCSCSCSSSTYKWDSANKGTANLSGTQCCNGKYSGCSETCADVAVPTNATGASTCSACGQTLFTNWNPNSGYCRL